jgi:CRISPR type IV-associated protein Csf1
MPQLKFNNIEAGSPCFMCGRKDFNVGIRRKKAIQSNFTDYGYCGNAGEYVCIYCMTSLSSIALKNASAYCVTTDSISLKKSVDVASLIKSPPTPPFLIGKGDGQRHTIFKSRVSVSRELFYIYNLPMGQPGRLIEVNKSEALRLAGILQSLAKSLKSKPYAVARHNFGKEKLSILSESENVLYDFLELNYGFNTDACWAALQILR